MSVRYVSLNAALPVGYDRLTNIETDKAPDSIWSMPDLKHIARFFSVGERVKEPAATFGIKLTMQDEEGVLNGKASAMVFTVAYLALSRNRPLHEAQIVWCFRSVFISQ